ncbi:hypothetical protein Tco_1236195 [Tanacetum coccineum]
MRVPPCQCTIQQSACSVLHLEIGGTIFDVEHKFHLLKPSVNPMAPSVPLKLWGWQFKNYFISIGGVDTTADATGKGGVSDMHLLRDGQTNGNEADDDETFYETVLEYGDDGADDEDLNGDDGE